MHKKIISKKKKKIIKKDICIIIQIKNRKRMVKKGLMLMTNKILYKEKKGNYCIVFHKL